MKRVLISDKNDMSPHAWWYKFVNSVNLGNNTFSTEQRIDIVNAELMKWSAQLWRDNATILSDSASDTKSAYLDFYDEQAYTWFIMRWA
jgi:hypothetical protein